VAAWLIERADAAVSRSTLAVALAAIKAGHQAAGQRFDAADPDLVRALAGARREVLREQRQAAPLRPAVLGDVLASLGDSDLDRRDAAMLATLYMLALRRSELVEIDYETRGDGLAVLRKTDHGLELELLRSKTSQEQPVIVAVDRNHNPRAFAALERWLDHAEIIPGSPLFRRTRPRGGIGETRVTADGVNRAIKSALARYYELTGTDRETARRLAKRFSGHSGRVGFVVAAKEAGAADSDIAATTRHKSLHMIKRYGETADQRRRAPHRLPGVGL
jgi:integrase